MIKTYKQLKDIYLTDGQKGRYATLYISKEDVEEEYENVVEFKELHGLEGTDLVYPLIVLDSTNSADSYIVSDVTKVLGEAKQFFN